MKLKTNDQQVLRREYNNRLSTSHFITVMLKIPYPHVVSRICELSFSKVDFSKCNALMTDISLINNTAWQEAKRRAEVIRPLVSGDKPCSQELVRGAAEQLSLSVRQVYELIRRFRLSDGSLSALVPFDREIRG
jgi:hypothetical protein